MRRHLQARALVFGALALAVLPSVGCGSGSGSGEPLPLVAVDASSTSPNEQAIAAAQERLQQVPDDDGARLTLALALLQRAREVGDPVLYGNAEALLDDLAERRPEEPDVLIGQATLALAQHRFREALDLARQATALTPDRPAALGVLVDASNEMGRYEDALAATQRMLDLRPDLASLSRASYARELRGDVDGAIALMDQAATAGSGGGGGGGENVAYVRVQLALLLLTRGDVESATSALVAAAAAFPDLPAVEIGAARIAVANGGLEDAARRLEDVIETQPILEAVILLGDIYDALDRADEAEQHYALVEAIAALYEENGVETDVDLALFAADHRPGDDAVDLAQKAFEARPGIHGHDALGWAHLTAGNLEAAREHSEAALALGSRDPLFRFHAASIAHAAGDTEAARRHLRIVLDGNPRFSPLHLDAVADLAAALRLDVPPSPS